MCNPAFTFGLSHAPRPVLTLTVSPSAGRVAMGGAASAGVVGGRLAALVG